MITTAVITFLACSAFLRVASVQQDREPPRLQRLAETICLFGALLCIPAALFGLYGSPRGWSPHWLELAMRLGSIGLVTVFGGTIAWMVIDAVYVRMHRRHVVARRMFHAAD